METQETPETDEQEQQPEEKGVAIYSKLAILLFSIFFSPLIGGILLMLNLRSVGYKKEGTRVLLIAILYQFISGIIVGSFFRNLPTHHTNDPQIFLNTKFIAYSLIANVVGGAILAEYYFKKYFPEDDYEHKSVWRPLIIILLISFSIALLRM
jgi:hypothetical protein